MDVQYATNLLAPGVLYFTCERMHAKLSVPACSSMWRKTNNEGDDAHSACKRCPLGALHAGERQASTSPLKGSMTCSRCHNPAPRLIGGEVCVSCKNREYEWVRGRNAKGTAPVKLKCLSRRRIRYLSGSEPCSLAVPLSLDMDELIVSALRSSKDQVRFGFGAVLPPTIPQLRLF